MNEFRTLMVESFGEEIVENVALVDPMVVDAFRIQISKEEINQYFLEVAERNGIPLEKINCMGHEVKVERDVRYSYPYPTEEIG